MVYRAFMDRFAPPDRPERKAALCPTPLRPRSATPCDPETRSYPHTAEFWDRDLPSPRRHLGYLPGLGALYLQPIFRAP